MTGSGSLGRPWGLCGPAPLPGGGGARNAGRRGIGASCRVWSRMPGRGPSPPHLQGSWNGTSHGVGGPPRYAGCRPRHTAQRCLGDGHRPCLVRFGRRMALLLQRAGHLRINRLCSRAVRLPWLAVRPDSSEILAPHAGRRGSFQSKPCRKSFLVMLLLSTPAAKPSKSSWQHMRFPVPGLAAPSRSCLPGCRRVWYWSSYPPAGRNCRQRHYVTAEIPQAI